MEAQIGRKTKPYHGSQSSEQLTESETEDEAIHVDEPAERWSKYGKEGHIPTEDLGPYAGNTDGEGGYYEERGYGVPILASDEIKPGQEHLQPAVSPAPFDQRGSMQDDYHLHRTGSAGNSRPTSRPASRPGSRPGSIHGLPHLSRFTSHDDEGMHTPLEDVDEYEPLFPDDDEKASKPKTQADRLKHRPDVIKKNRFPSQDIWEDAPASVQLQAEVETPEPVQAQAPPPTKATFEPPEAEAARKGEASESEKSKLIPREERLAASHFKPHLRAEMHRPGMQHRFPSQDIWEDSPDSSKLETTVGEETEDDVTSPKDTGLAAGAVVYSQAIPREGAIAGQPTVPPRPSRSKGAVEAELPQIPMRPRKQASDSTTEGSSPTGIRKRTLPDRPKPQVPPRPNKQSSQDSAGAPLTHTTSASSNEGAGVKSPPITSKAKPQVPARPAGSKIAALQAGFMADLNSRLKVGPQPHKPQEEEEKQAEKEALQDARKGRARGPAKRRPAASPGAAAAATKPAEPTFSISTPWTIFSSSSSGELSVPGMNSASETTKPTPMEPHESVPTMATNTAGETLHPSEAAPMPGKAPLDEKSSAQVDQTSQSAEHVDTATQDDPVPALSKNEPIASESLAKDEPLTKTTSADYGVQTGEKTIMMDAESESPTKLTVTEGGAAQEEGTVVQKE